jgi:hypothetical protein
MEDQGDLTRPDLVGLKLSSSSEPGLVLSAQPQRQAFALLLLGALLLDPQDQNVLEHWALFAEPLELPPAAPFSAEKEEAAEEKE